MFKFRFKCSDEGRVRTAFENNKFYDRPAGKGIFGNDLQDKGIHFKECGKQIKGFYISESEAEATKGAPIRVEFNGCFIKREDGTFFEVYIYPKPMEFLLVLIAYIILSLASGLFGFLFSTLIFIGFMYVYICNIKETVNIFKKMVR